MNSLGKRLSSIFIMIICVFSISSLTACNNTVDIRKFYDKVVESQACLDEVADDIYSYWYDAIYKDKYSGNINTAIYMARINNSDNLSTIELNEPEMQSLYKKVRDSKLSSEIKSVMTAYSDYYEFVVNVSGSFNSYSASKETLKKELSSALKELSLEI